MIFNPIMQTSNRPNLFPHLKRKCQQHYTLHKISAFISAVYHCLMQRLLASVIMDFQAFFFSPFCQASTTYCLKNKEKMMKLSNKTTRKMWLSFNIVRKHLTSLLLAWKHVGPALAPLQRRSHLGVARLAESDSENAD